MNAVEWRLHRDAQWQLSLPAGITGAVVAHTNPELTRIAVFRGWVGDDALFVGVSTRPRTHPTLRAEMRHLSRDFAGGASDGERVTVAGARDARRVDGLMDVEDGCGEPPEWTERVTCVLAPLGKDGLAVLTIRRHPAADRAAVVDEIVRSFALRG